MMQIAAWTWDYSSQYSTIIIVHASINNFYSLIVLKLCLCGFSVVYVGLVVSTSVNWSALKTHVQKNLFLYVEGDFNRAQLRARCIRSSTADDRVSAFVGPTVWNSFRRSMQRFASIPTPQMCVWLHRTLKMRERKMRDWKMIVLISKMHGSRKRINDWIA